MPATIDDIARKAKVSISTVSRVLNRPWLVKLETRSRVQRIIVRLNYHPNIYAQALMQSRSNIPNLGATGATREGASVATFDP
jgi:LacI family transcriptional regulator